MGKGREGLKEREGGGGLQNFLIIPLKWGALLLGEGGLLRANLQGGLRSIERGESRPRDLLTKKRRAQVTKMDTWVGEGGNSFIEVLRCRNSRSNTMFIYPLCAVYVGEVLFFVYFFSCLCVACENIRFSSLLAAGDVSRRGNVPSGEKRGETDIFAG